MKGYCLESPVFIKLFTTVYFEILLKTEPLKERKIFKKSMVSELNAFMSGSMKIDLKGRDL